MKILPFLLALILLPVLFCGCSENKPASEPDVSQPDVSLLDVTQPDVTQPEMTQPDVSLFNVVCSADEALEMAKDAGIPVMENHRCTAGQDTWDAFYKTVSAGKPSQVLCAMYYTLDPALLSAELYAQEKDSYPQLFFFLLTYDGETYTIKVRLSSETKLDCQDSFPLLLHLSGTSTTPHVYDYDSYVLVDDPTATWDGIWAGLVSSQFGAGYRHHFVYINYMD